MSKPTTSSYIAEIKRLLTPTDGHTTGYGDLGVWLHKNGHNLCAQLLAAQEMAKALEEAKFVSILNGFSDDYKNLMNNALIAWRDAGGAE